MAPSSSWKEVERDLVAEQPGLGTSFVGLFLALFMGLAIRAIIAPERIREQIAHATSKIHHEINLSFKDAYVSLAHGMWPDLSVVITGIQMDSSKSCWLNPSAEINEIRLPLSLSHLLRGRIFIHEIEADQVSLSLHSEYKKCEDSSNENKGASNQGIGKTSRSIAQSKGPVLPVLGAFENVKRKNPIDTIRINSLQIHYLPVAFTSFEIVNFKLQLQSEVPREVSMVGQLNLGGDTLIGDYSSHADLKIDAVEGDTPLVSMTAKGIWREGQYDVAMHLNPQNQNYDLQTDIRHLPLSQVIPLLKKYHFMESDFNGRQAWFSGHMKTEGELSHAKQAAVHLEGLKIEGDLGEVSCRQAEIQSIEPLKFAPMDFDIHGLNLQQMLVFLNRSHPTPALGSLGIFNGTAHFINPEDLSIRGDYSGLEFIFSNQGERQVQPLSLVSGELQFKKDHWLIEVDRIKPFEGIFDGNVKISADKDFRDLQIETKIEELSLDPQVQALMTHGGSLGALSGQLKAHMQRAEITDLHGQLRWDQLIINGIHVTRPKLSLETSKDETHLEASAQNMDFDLKSTEVSQVLAPLFSERKEDETNPRYWIKSPTVKIKTNKLKTLAWSQFQAQTEQGLLRSEGSWDEKGNLLGQLNFSDSKNKKEFWELSGTRNKPRLSKK